MAKNHPKKKREWRDACVKVFGCDLLRPCNPPSTWLYVLWAPQHQKRRQAYDTADRSLFMVDEQRCVYGGGGFNKAECISPGMKLQRLEGAEERGKAAEVLQISVCEWAQVHVHSFGICPEVCVCVPFCVWQGGVEEGSLLRAVADVSVLNGHSARSVWEALALRKGLCMRRRGAEELCSVEKHQGADKNAPANLKDTQLFHFFSVLCSEACNNDSLNWSRAREALCHAEWILTDEILCSLFRGHFLSTGNENTRSAQYRDLIQLFSLVSSQWLFFNTQWCANFRYSQYGSFEVCRFWV